MKSKKETVIMAFELLFVTSIMIAIGFLAVFGNLKKETHIDVSKLQDLPYIQYGTGDKVIYVISDPECPYCLLQHFEVKRLLRINKDIQVRYILYPLPFHKYAKKLSETVFCYPENQRPVFLDRIFLLQNRPENYPEIIHSCTYGKQAINKTLQVLDQFNIQGVPVIVLPNGKYIEGLTKAERIKSMISYEEISVKEQ